MAAGATAATIFIFLLSIFSNPVTAHLSSDGSGLISVLISEKGLSFVKDLLIEQAVDSLTPLRLPNIQKSVKIPLIGGVQVSLSNITLTHINVSSSTIHPGDTGIVIVASGAVADLSMDWRYSYSTWLIPIEIFDKGNAHIQAEGTEIGLTLSMKSEEGTLKLISMECGCYMKHIIIALDGGASWFYQGLVDAFEDQIRSAVEKAITKKITEGISKLDSLLHNLPKKVKVDDVVSLNVTFMDDPLLGKSSVQFDIDGLFDPTYKVDAPDFFRRNLQLPISCGEPSKMLGISLDEAVFNSAIALYYEAGLMHFNVDKVPDQSLLNTAGWRYIIPQLYKKYPNDDMKLNISLTSPPVVRITSDKVGATISSDMIIDVLDASETIPVACISVVVTASGVMEISGNNLVGQAVLDDFSLKLKWSDVGNFHMFLIQRVMRVFLNTIFMSYVNFHLRNGFPLPIIHGFTLQNASTLSAESTIVVCSDVVFSNSANMRLLPL